MEGKVIIDGDASRLLNMMQQAGNAIRGFESQATGSFGKVQTSIMQMQAKWVALGAFILGGAGFKEAVDTSVKLTKEANSLSRALGISATEASVLNVALGDIYQSQETLIAANAKLTQTLKKDEEAFTNLGVATRDQNGNFRNSLDIMLDVNSKLLEFKEGTDRNIEGTKIYGKAWNDIAPLLKLNTELLDESRKKAHDLNLVVGAENVEATAKYRAAMNDTEDVLTAVKKTIGDAVMPILTDLGNEFAEGGPDKVEIMRKAMGVLVGTLYGLKMAAEIVWISLKTILQTMATGFATVAKVAALAFEGDFDGAKEAWREGWSEIGVITDSAGAALAKSVSKNSEAMVRAVQGGFGKANVTPTARASGSDGTSAGGDKKEKDDSRLRMWEAELAEYRLVQQEKALAEGRFFQMSKEAELQFWKDKLQLADAGSKEESALRLKVAVLGQAVLKDQFDSEQERLRTQMEMAKNDYAQRETLARQFAENARQRFGQESKEYQAALKQQEQMRREHEQKLIEIASIRNANVRKMGDALIEEKGRQAQLEYDLGLITREQLLQIQRQYILERMANDLQAADAEIASFNAGTVEYERAQAKKLEIKRQFDAQLSENNKEQTREKNQPALNIFGTAQSGIEQAMTDMLLKSRTWAQAMNSIYKNVGTAFIQEIITKPMAAFVVGMAKQLAVNLGFLQTEQAQQAAAAIEGSIIKKTVAFGEIMANAGIAGSGAYAAMASIPYVGPVIAPAAAAAAFAGASAYSASLFSAAGGFDIPRGMNPMTQLHQEEMVLPAKYASGLRDIINNGSAGQASPSFSVTIQAVDGKSVERLLMGNKNLLVNALKSAYRDGAR